VFIEIETKSIGPNNKTYAFAAWPMI